MHLFFVKIWMALTSIWRIHVGLHGLIVFAILAAILYTYILKEPILFLIKLISASYDPSSGWHSLLLGAASSVLAALIIGVFGIFLFGWYSKIKLTGSYAAYDIGENGRETPWGNITIKYHPLGKNGINIPVKLQLKHKDIIMDGDGQIIDNRYLIGYYTETGKPERRRSGSFTYELDGTGNVWQGKYNCIDPDSVHPIIGIAKWVRQ